eukprot:TRINITY_DN2253_c0_g1_i6.p2 TRINITY_DN2253_c0_g1~~TRINITY_DN2253_c0_g1_i6.p2  ORF type:complete len:110 (-),score=13.35 TRINITY_DN2253_c0_g1_i6:600-929(-)
MLREGRICGACGESAQFRAYSLPQKGHLNSKINFKIRFFATLLMTHILPHTMSAQVKGVNGMGLEVCCTLGMLSLDQAKQLKEAGLSAYNHNLDTSREHYAKVRNFKLK